MFAIKLKNGTSAGWLAGAWVSIGFSSVYCLHANREISSYCRCCGGQIPLLWQFYLNIIVQTQRCRCCANACIRNEKISTTWGMSPKADSNQTMSKLLMPLHRLVFAPHRRKSIFECTPATLDSIATMCMTTTSIQAHSRDFINRNSFELFVCFRGNDCDYFGTIHLFQFSPRARSSFPFSIFHFLILLNLFIFCLLSRCVSEIACIPFNGLSKTIYCK